MKNLKFFKRPLVFIPSLIILGLMIFFISRGGSSVLKGVETQKVKRTTITQAVSESGVVKPTHSVALSFGTGGRVKGVLVEVGDRVTKGQLLATLDTTRAYLGLSSARAELSAALLSQDELERGARDVDRSVATSAVEAAEITLKYSKETQDQLVENARESYYSNDLRAYLTSGGTENDNKSYTPPTISGSYKGGESGKYVIELYPSSTQSGYSFRYSGIEKGLGTVSTVEPQPLGKNGLFIQFPEDFARGTNLEWTIFVPNTRSTTYLQLKNALETAIKTRASVLEQSEAALKQAQARGDQATASATPSALESKVAEVLRARGSLIMAETALDESTIRSPFSGVVTDVSISNAESASPGVPVISVISSEPFEVTLNIPEEDIRSVKIGDTAEITFDAYGEKKFKAEVTHIAPKAKVVEGVTTVEVTLGLLDVDESMIAGLSADADILTNKRENVLTVPGRALVEEDGKTYVRTLKGGNKISAIKLLPVEIGLRGSDGSVEIISGLSEDQTIVTFIPEALQNELKDLKKSENKR